MRRSATLVDLHSTVFSCYPTGRITAYTERTIVQNAILRLIVCVLCVACVFGSSQADDLSDIDREITWLELRAFQLDTSEWRWARDDVPKFRDGIVVIRSGRDVIVELIAAGVPDELLTLALAELWRDMNALDDCFSFYDGGGQRPQELDGLAGP